MIVNKSDLVFNINTLVCLPILYEDMANTYEYNFKYVYLFENTAEGTNQFIQFVKRNNIKEILFVDYRLEYETIVETFRDEISFNLLFTIDLASLSVESYLYYHDSVISMYKDGKIKKLGVLDRNLYLITKPQFEETYLIKLDEPKIEDKANHTKEGIGLINISDDPKHSYFNELSAINLIDEQANLIGESKDVNIFLKEFNVKNKKYSNLNDTICNSEIALYVNFCNTNNLLFLRCMDAGTICILGNNSIINNNEILSNNLQVKSDDDINEIAQKIQDAKNNKKIIFEEYAKFRKQYSIQSKESLSKFVIGNNEEIDSKESEKILTIGIPVYNVEKYVGASIQSVINAIGENTEILIVNDGSTDNSERVILEYKEKYPELIRYIKQENHGLGNVRNVILENAKGKYIASIDSDDTVNKNFFKEATKYMESNIDMIICDWLSIPTNQNKYVTEAADNGLDFSSAYKKLLYSTIMPSNCNKIMKKDLYNKLKLKFVEGHKFEDLGTNPIVLNEVETIKYINKPYYEYNIRENSIMRTKVGYNMIDILRILEDRFASISSNLKIDKNEFIAYVYFWRVEDSILNQLYTLDEDERNNMIDYIYENMYDILESLYKDNEYVNMLISRIDNETKNYITERNEKIISRELKTFISEKVNKKEYKILTPALILYNYDNRVKEGENG